MKIYLQNETTKLWDFADQNRTFPFKTIGDVLEENQRLKEEVQWLNDVITTNISEIYIQLDAMFSQHSEDIASVRTNFAENITSLRTDIVSLKLVDNLHS